MKNIFLIVLLCSFTTLHLAADTGAFGFFGSTEYNFFPDSEEVYQRFSAAEDINPGFLIYFREQDMGGSFDFGFMFRPDEPAVYGPDHTWWMDFTFNGTVNYHVFNERLPIDPFFGLGGGFGMVVDITEYEEYGYPEDWSPYGDEGLTNFSFYPLIRAGLNIHIGNIFLRGHMDLRPFNLALPIANVMPYGQDRVRVVLAIGFHFN
jgi:hypothetical protein